MTEKEASCSHDIFPTTWAKCKMYSAKLTFTMHNSHNRYRALSVLKVIAIVLHTRKQSPYLSKYFARQTRIYQGTLHTNVPLLNLLTSETHSLQYQHWRARCHQNDRQIQHHQKYTKVNRLTLKDRLRQ